jgi:hypothetical protein
MRRRWCQVEAFDWVSDSVRKRCRRRFQPSGNAARCGSRAGRAPQCDEQRPQELDAAVGVHSSSPAWVQGDAPGDIGRDAG